MLDRIEIVAKCQLRFEKLALYPLEMRPDKSQINVFQRGLMVYTVIERDGSGKPYQLLFLLMVCAYRRGTFTDIVGIFTVVLA